MRQLLFEALMVGLSNVIMCLFVYYLIKNMTKISNEYLKLILVVFLAGLILHLMFEYLKLNLWYCKNGNACL